MKIVRKTVLLLTRICAVYFFSLPIAHAQTFPDNPSRFGIKGGINLSNLNAENVDAENMILGVHGGLFLKIAISNHLAIQPELLYTMKGSKLTYENNFASGTAKYSLNYLEVPLLIVINPVKNLNLQGGVYVSTLTQAKIKNKSSVDMFDFEKELNKKDFENLDYGLVAGLGTEFNKLSFSIRYEYGLGNVGKEKTILGQTYRFPDAKNSTFQLYIGLSIL